MSRPAEDHSFKRFGNWVALYFDGVRKGNRYWMCRCDCGTRRSVGIERLKRGRTKSCGCMNFGPVTHGLRFKPVYGSWRGMKKRCLCPNHEAYHNYGGRGIEICEFLIQSPEAIVQTIGHRPKGKTLDRIENSGNYNCGKCDECLQNGWPMNIKWSTPIEQARNARFNKIVTIEGVSRPACEWADIFGLNRDVFYQRLRVGKSGAELTRPPRRRVP